jgi:hypothetical protein
MLNAATSASKRRVDMLHDTLQTTNRKLSGSNVSVLEPSPAKERQCQPDEVICRAAGFSLNKFYLDAVCDSGNYFIGYAADLSFKHLSLGYADTLHSPKLHGIHRGPITGWGLQPTQQDGVLEWKHRGLGIEAHWSPIIRSKKVELLSTPQGHVDWHCLQPAAKVLLKTSSGLAVKALGYCEHLSLTIPPWKLGLTELVWGRFVSAAQSVVWIVWSGKYPMRLVIWNNKSIDHADISERYVNTDDFALAIEPVRVLRQGYLGHNVFSKVPVVRNLVPDALQQVHEIKQLSRGTLQMSGGEQHEGWIIHEKVIWPR